jgi:hypothetical protein
MTFWRYIEKPAEFRSCHSNMDEGDMGMELNRMIQDTLVPGRLQANFS